MSKDIPQIGGTPVGDNIQVMSIDRLLNAVGVSEEQQVALYETCCVCGETKAGVHAYSPCEHNTESIDGDEILIPEICNECMGVAMNVAKRMGINLDKVNYVNMCEGGKTIGEFVDMAHDYYSTCDDEQTG